MSLRLSARTFVAALFLSAAAAGAMANAAELVLRVGSNSSANQLGDGSAMGKFARGIEADGNGRVEVQLKPVTSFPNPAAIFEHTESGETEIAQTLQGNNPGRFPQSSVMELPLMFEDAVSGSRVMWSLYKEGLLDKDYASVKVLGLYVVQPSGIFTTGRKISQIKDLRGLRIRAASPTVGLALARLGMIPLAVPTPQIAEAVEAGTLDAIAYGFSTARTASIGRGKTVGDVARVLVDANFAGPAFMVVMNKAKWDALPVDIQAVLQKHADDLMIPQARARVADEAAARDEMRKDPRYTYVPLSVAQRAEMEKLVAPVVADWKSKMAQQGVDAERLYARARELLQQFRTAAK
jgi:TRAP-type transport system periplasmic protein